MADEHARDLQPSAGKVWVNCPGFLGLRKQTPALAAEITENPEGPEGTAAHFFGALGIERRMRCLGEPEVGNVADNGIPLDEEMQGCIQWLIDDVCSVARSVGVSPGTPLFRVEELVHCERIHKECWGTPDVWLFDKQAWKLYLWDYKHGHLAVDAWENWQAIIYLAGIICDELKIKPNDRLSVSVRIVAPRVYSDGLGPIRTWDITGDQLPRYWDQARESARIGLGGDAFCAVGPHCRDCECRWNCDTFARSASAAVDYAGKASPSDLTTQGAEVEYIILKRAEELLKRRMIAVEERLKSDAMGGAATPRLDIRPGKGRAAWIDPSKIIALGDFQKVDLRAPVKPCTPKQAKDRGLSAKMVEALTHRPDTGLKIKVVDSKRLFAKQKGNIS